MFNKVKKKIKILISKIKNYFLIKKTKIIFNGVKLIIWDLDETLYFQPNLIEKTRKIYEKEFLNISSKNTIKKFKKLEKKYRWFEILAKAKNINYKQIIIDLDQKIKKEKFIKKNNKLVKIINKISRVKKQIILTNSSKNSAKKILEKIGFTKLDKTFIKVVSVENMSKPKPNRQILKKILKEFNLKNKEVILIGNSKKEDIDLANKIGMKTIQIRNFSLTAKKANLIFESIDQFIDTMYESKIF